MPNEYIPIEEAAARLALTPVALRARCCRAERSRYTRAVARMWPLVRGFSWASTRVSLRNASATASRA